MTYACNIESKHMRLNSARSEDKSNQEWEINSRVFRLLVMCELCPSFFFFLSSLATNPVHPTVSQQPRQLLHELVVRVPHGLLGLACCPSTGAATTTRSGGLGGRHDLG